jgi:hypothetical protein
VSDLSDVAAGADPEPQGDFAGQSPTHRHSMRGLAQMGLEPIGRGGGDKIP